jgi:hypothetical protein
MRAFPVSAGIAVAISLNAVAQTPPPLLARASTPRAKFTSGEGWVPAIEKYKKELYDRVYAQWLARVKAHDAELKIGTVRVRLTVTETGQFVICAFCRLARVDASKDSPSTRLIIPKLHHHRS